MKNIDIERKAIDIINKLDNEHSLLANFLITDTGNIMFHTRSRRMADVCVGVEFTVNNFMSMTKNHCVNLITYNHRDYLLAYMHLK